MSKLKCFEKMIHILWGRHKFHLEKNFNMKKWEQSETWRTWYWFHVSEELHSKGLSGS